MERHVGIKEQLALNLKLSVGLMAIGIWQFDTAVKREIRKKQNYRCAHDGCETTDYSLPVHHKVPEKGLEKFGIEGRNVKENGIGLCHNHHNLWDRLALEEQIIYPGIPLSEVPKGLYRTLWQKRK